MNNHDLCLAWNWEYDADFIKELARICGQKDISMLQATPVNLDGLLHALKNQQIIFHTFLDRASEADARFQPLVDWVYEQNIFCLNHHEHAERSCNKAEMHYRLINAGIYTPYTIILPSYEEQPLLSAVDLNLVGKTFIIKPAHGGGGEGVVTNATTLRQVLDARLEHPADRYLLQAHIVPRKLETHPAWFRVLYCAGYVYPCWWNPYNGIYAPVTVNQEDRFGLRSLRDISNTIARLSKLDMFSSEIALTADGIFVVIDYVNDQPDLRMQSKAMDGVPDHIVRDIALHLVELVATHR